MDIDNLTDLALRPFFAGAILLRQIRDQRK